VCHDVDGFDSTLRGSVRGHAEYQPGNGPGPGFEAGWIVVHHTVEVMDADHIESVGSNSFHRLNGEVYRTGCSTATGTRFE
jgi:hypothetical protein